MTIAQRRALEAAAIAFLSLAASITCRHLGLYALAFYLAIPGSWYVGETITRCTRLRDR